MASIRCAPNDQWFGRRTPLDKRRRATFNARWSTTLSDFERELDFIQARDVRIGLDAYPSQIRVDGWPKGGAAIPPPVTVTFDSSRGPLRFECDRYHDWRDNLRAIGLTLHRLRLVDEAGVAQSGEQYRGFAALPPAGGNARVEAAALLLATWADMNPGVDNIVRFDGAREIAYRKALKRVHPDQGGSREDFDAVRAAKQLLDRERPL